MLFWIIKWFLISVLNIVLLHNLYLFFINTLTIPKVKDLINKPIEHYNEIQSFTNESNYESDISNVKEHTSENDMQNELKSFLNNIKKEEIMTADVLISSNYSTY